MSQGYAFLTYTIAGTLILTNIQPPVVAATQITVVINDANNPPQLAVIGTNGNDNIEISQTPTSISVNNFFTFVGNFNNQINIYEFNGQDTIKIDYSVTANMVIHCGNGNNTIYDTGRGQDIIYVGSGADTIISFGEGNAHQVYGGAGMDSFWVDKNTTLHNVSVAETNAGTVHLISQL